MVRVEGEFVVGDEVARDGFSVVGTKQLCGRMPELADVVRFDGVKSIFKFSISLTEFLVEGRFVLHGREIEGFARREDNGLFREVAIMWVVKTICKYGVRLAMRRKSWVRG